MNDFTDDELVDFVLGLGSDARLLKAVRARPELRERCTALQTELGGLEDELAGLLADGADADDLLAEESWRVLLAVDRSPCARTATRTALALALRGACVVEVLHVCCHGQSGRWPGPLPGETPAEGVALLEPVLGELRAHGVTCRGQLRSAPFDKVARHIVWEAEEIAAHVIVLGGGRTSWLAAVFSTGVTAEVVRRASCPVFVAR
jgi:nucleotide-binding universal stress UspA family protein